MPGIRYNSSSSTYRLLIALSFVPCLAVMFYKHSVLDRELLGKEGVKLLWKANLPVVVVGVLILVLFTVLVVVFRERLRGGLAVLLIVTVYVAYSMMLVTHIPYVKYEYKDLHSEGKTVTVESYVLCSGRNPRTDSECSYLCIDDNGELVMLEIPHSVKVNFSASPTAEKYSGSELYLEVKDSFPDAELYCGKIQVKYYPNTIIYIDSSFA